MEEGNGVPPVKGLKRKNGKMESVVLVGWLVNWLLPSCIMEILSLV